MDNTTQFESSRNEAQITWQPEVAIFMACIAIFGTIGNVFIIAAVLLHKKLRRAANIFVVNLAIADIIITAYIMPIGIATSQYRITPFSYIVCDINAFLITTTCGVSTQSLMLIAVERYFLICHFRYHRNVFSNKLIILYTCIAWVYTMIWACQGWTGWTRFVYGVDTYICTFHGPQSFSYNICLAVFDMLLPIAVLIFCYVSIFKTAWKSRIAVDMKPMSNSQNNNSTTLTLSPQMKKRQRKEYNLIFTLFAIVVVFIVCWAPAAVVLALAAILDMPVVLFTVTIWIALSNSVLNSIVYGTLNRNFRQGYLNFLRHLFCCCIDLKTKTCRRRCCKCCMECCSVMHSKDNHTASTSSSKLNSGDSNFSQLSKQSINTQVSVTSLSQNIPMATLAVQNKDACRQNRHVTQIITPQNQLTGEKSSDEGNSKSRTFSSKSVISYSEVVFETHL